MISPSPILDVLSKHIYQRNKLRLNKRIPKQLFTIFMHNKIITIKTQRFLFFIFKLLNRILFANQKRFRFGTVANHQSALSAKLTLNPSSIYFSPEFRNPFLSWLSGIIIIIIIIVILTFTLRNVREVCPSFRLSLLGQGV